MQEQQTKTLKVEVRTAKNAWEQGTTDCVGLFTPFDRGRVFMCYKLLAT